MNKWILSAIAYLAIVILGYYMYDSFFQAETEPSVKESEHEDHGSGHEHGEEVGSNNDVKVTVEETDEKITITLKDLSGQPVTELETNHEKKLHLIVVDEHLAVYEHLHSDEVAPGVFEIVSPLEEGNYLAFVDIKPANLAYTVRPVSFKVGDVSSSEHTHHSLEIDKVLAKTIDGQKVSLETTELKAGIPVTLTFTVHDATVEPYLGAMGHVVILNEEATEYVHVHPLNNNETVFETQFAKPGIYKMWGEFQQGGKVGVYPFVVEVK
ncbi:hypothetical protein LS684_01960 [Cytobacillus spongiae]|uniref:hypothetical protein n=1 Tax=Cytobacillus spongiae TaxID=2901381 RepID=UPI001F4642A2|nr:hypothetical protein [Cytobacillus spongiae]UII56277.1 hypothetical protein LS684_01960 [Cytobacillus spongiae]